ncbi:hypothetical protein D3C80_518800 [compost metagenome]
MASRLILLRGEVESWAAFRNYESFFNVRDLYSEPLLGTLVEDAQLASTGGGVFIAVAPDIETAKKQANRFYYAAPENWPRDMVVYPVRWGNDSMILDLIQHVQTENLPLVVNVAHARLIPPSNDGCHGSFPSGAN